MLQGRLPTRAVAARSVARVVQRTASVVLDLEKQLVDRDIVLVAHGDPLQILQTWFLTVDPRKHRHYPHLNTGEARQVCTAPLKPPCICGCGCGCVGV
jgi:broad specificity phosphatase PhoE